MTWYLENCRAALYIGSEIGRDLSFVFSFELQLTWCTPSWVCGF